MTFGPRETCKPVTVTVQGDDLPSTSATTSVKASVIHTSGGVVGDEAIVFTEVSEDDGVTGVQPAPALVARGDRSAGGRRQVSAHHGRAPR